MAADDYVSCSVSAPLRGALPPTPWDDALHRRMRDVGKAAFEEALLPVLLDDLRRGRPG
jgi:hypothetical protein